MNALHTVQWQVLRLEEDFRLKKMVDTFASLAPKNPVFANIHKELTDLFAAQPAAGTDSFAPFGGCRCCTIHRRDMVRWENWNRWRKMKCRTRCTISNIVSFPFSDMDIREKDAIVCCWIPCQNVRTVAQTPVFYTC